jgi:hypothetical protein
MPVRQCMKTITDDSVEDHYLFCGCKNAERSWSWEYFEWAFSEDCFPFVKRNAKMFGTRALKTGMEIADDVVEGKSIKDSLKTRVPTRIKRMASDVKWQSGSGVKRRKVAKRKPVKRKRTVKRQVKRKRQVKSKRQVKGKYIF